MDFRGVEMKIEVLIMNSMSDTDSIRIVLFQASNSGKSIFEITEFKKNDMKKLRDYVRHIENTAIEMSAESVYVDKTGLETFGRARTLLGKILKVIENLR